MVITNEKTGLLRPLLLVAVFGFCVSLMLAGAKLGEPYCTNCSSEDTVLCSETFEHVQTSDLRFGGFAKKWTCDKCHREWNAPLINLHRQHSLGCAQVVYY